MEGVIDFAMREILTSGGSYTYGLTECMRVNDHLLSKSQFTKYAPELLMDGRTRSGTPIYIQLLGQEKNWMAENGNYTNSLSNIGGANTDKDHYTIEATGGSTFLITATAKGAQTSDTDCNVYTIDNFGRKLAKKSDTFDNSQKCRGS